MQKGWIKKQKSGSIGSSEELFDSLIGRGDEDLFAAKPRIFLKSGDNGDFRLVDITDQYHALVKKVNELEKKLTKEGNVLLTVSEVAELFRCHEQHVRNMKSKGKFREDRHYINFGGKVLFVKENLCKDFGLRVGTGG